MNMRMIPAMLLMLVSACATTASARDEAPDPARVKALEGKSAGTPRSCISFSDAQSSTTYRDAVVYRVNSKLSYVNDLGKCPFLGNDNILVTRTTSSQLCRGDIVNMIDRSSGFPSGSCAFSDFVPYQSTAK